MNTFTLLPASSLVCLGIRLAAINPAGDLLFPARAHDGSLVHAPLGSHPEEELGFASEMLDAAASLCRNDSAGDAAGCVRRHSLVEFAESVKQEGDMTLRTRFLWTREERYSGPKTNVPHGESFMMFEMGDLTRARALQIARGFRGFDMEVHQLQRLRTGNIAPGDGPTSELIVSSLYRDFWDRLLGLEPSESRRSLFFSDDLATAALLASHLYLEAPDAFSEGFDVLDSTSSQLGQPRASLRFDDRGRPVFLKGGEPLDPNRIRFRGREASLVSKKRIFHSGEYQPAASVLWEMESGLRMVMTRDPSNGSLAPSVFLKEAAEKARMLIQDEIDCFDRLSEVEQRATIEFRAYSGPAKEQA